MNLRRDFERFCYKNRNKGIPNLMLYICIGCGIVSILSSLGYSNIYYLLCFDRELILQGQVWRLFSYVFTMAGGNFLTTLILLYCLYSIGNAVASYWGNCKFNLYYLGGILLMDLYAMIFGGFTLLYSSETGSWHFVQQGIPNFYTTHMMVFLHLSMTLCYATMNPEAQFLLMYIIPIKARVLSLIYLAYSLFIMVQYTLPDTFLPHNLFPLVGLGCYFLFFGKDVLNLLPLSWRAKAGRTPKKKVRTSAPHHEPIPLRKEAKKATPVTYHHRCTVCGRTDTEYPELEFRYCSRCSGYHCYCQDHISNHEHVQ